MTTTLDIIAMTVGYLWLCCSGFVFTLNLWFLTRKHVRYFARRLKTAASSPRVTHITCVILDGTKIGLAQREPEKKD